MAKSPYTELPEPLKTLLPNMFSWYSKLDEATPSSWFVWTDKEARSYDLEICHNNLYYDVGGWDNLVTAVPKSDELSLEYLRMLIRGPFKSISDLIRLDRCGNNYYLHLLSLDKWPANVLMNFCIASRVPIEFDYLLSPWAQRCEKGFEPTLAWLLTYSYGVKQGTHEQFDYRAFEMARPGHLWLDPASSWTNILSGTFTKVSKSFKTHPHESRPTNVIWGHSSDYEDLVKMTDEQIAEFYSKPIQVLEAPSKPEPKVNVKKYFQLGQPPQPDEHWGMPVPIANPALEIAQQQPWPVLPVWNMIMHPEHEGPNNEPENNDEWFPEENDD